MNEFALIKQFFQSLKAKDHNVLVGSGDDAAVLSVPNNYELAVSTDALVSGVHFLADWDPFDIAYKVIAVNVSDMAAMGATPKWVSMALCLPDVDSHWLQRFSDGIKHLLELYQIDLIGGDLTRGPLTITVTIQGLLPQGMRLCRNQAKEGDSIYVTGYLGGAALAVANLFDNQIGDDLATVLALLKQPSARVEHGLTLLPYANAAIDISDGFSADLNHICQASSVGARLYETQIPIHPVVTKHLGKKACRYALQGGDDYELCFTVRADNKKAAEDALTNNHLNFYEVGIIERSPGLKLIDESGLSQSFEPTGYQHFDG